MRWFLTDKHSVESKVAFKKDVNQKRHDSHLGFYSGSPKERTLIDSNTLRAKCCETLFNRLISFRSVFKRVGRGGGTLDNGQSAGERHA